MTSVTRFLRQATPGLSTYLASSQATIIYVFVPSSGNYVGNYPPGYMREVPNGSIGLPNSQNGLQPSSYSLRDMGKTVVAGLSTDSGVTIGVPTYFRAVQVIFPTLTGDPAFGVQGSYPGTLPSGNPGDMGYNTFYIREIVGGVGNIASAAALLGGQL
jgi:hypothetical protein